MPEIQLETGTIHYEEEGPRDGRPVVFVHGYLMGGDLWGELARRLAGRGLRCLMPTWPLGAHRQAMKPDADTSPRGVATTIARFLDALDLEDVVLVGNDTGGALCQVVAVDHPQRLGAVVLTNCDAFDNFPPKIFRPLIAAAKLPGGLKAVFAPLKTAAARKSPAGYGMLSHHDVDHLASGWVKGLEQAGVLEDVRRFTLGLDPEVTQDAASRLSGFDRPVLLAWGTDDKLFPLEHAHRLAAILPNARVEAIPDSRTFVMLDQPDRLADLVAEVATQPASVDSLS
jgi:pimeloyl-ACP methyl ester carboxylesterase